MLARSSETLLLLDEGWCDVDVVAPYSDGETLLTDDSSAGPFP